MILAIPVVIFFYTVAAILAGRGLLQPKDHNIPRSIKLRQIFSAGQNTTGLAQHAAAALLKHQSGRRSFAPAIDEGGWWFAQYRVGRTRNLTLMVDTGSTDIAVNPGLYRPSKRGQSINVTKSLSFGTAQPDGCGLADIRFDEYRDHVAVDGLFVPRQHFANVVLPPQQPVDPGNGTTTVLYPGEGVIGWSTAASSQLGSSSWFEKLCAQHAVPDCRFGIVLRTDGTGELYLGGLDPTLFDGQLNTASFLKPWSLNGDVGVNGKAVDKNVTFTFDTGTANIIGPIAAVQKIFDAAGIQSSLNTAEGCSEILLGSYDCSSPPQIGFSFPYNNTGDGDMAEFLNVEPEAFSAAASIASDGSGNCTSTLIGIDLPSSSEQNEMWIVGQSWFQGKYVDHNLKDQMMGFASLKSKNVDDS